MSVLHLRVVTPSERTDVLVAALSAVPDVVNLVVLEGAARKPTGDVVMLEVPSESANRVIAMLRARGVDRDGSITIDRGSTVISAAADLAVSLAPGSSSEAVVWAEVESRSEADSELTVTFVVMFVVATLIAAVGILSDSVVLVIGAMVISPEYPPLLGASLGTFFRRRGHVMSALRTLGIGFGAGITAALLFAALVRGLGATPDLYELGARPLTQFISHPDGWTVVVSALAGVAGTISATQARPSALVGVFISVTTMPAAANFAVATVHGRGDEAVGAIVQLALNLAIIIVAGTVTLAVEHSVGARLGRGRRRPLP
jgi:uncharacterized hydrophobic protein (TIGR00271 family)